VKFTIVTLLTDQMFLFQIEEIWQSKQPLNSTTLAKLIEMVKSELGDRASELKETEGLDNHLFHVVKTWLRGILEEVMFTPTCTLSYSVDRASGPKFLTKKTVMLMFAFHTFLVEGAERYPAAKYILR